MKKHYLTDQKVWHRNKLLNMPEKDQSMDNYTYFEKKNDEAIDIISIENYVTLEEQYANELFDEYQKRNNDIPRA